jgi:predicted nucleotidyltransferase
MSEIIKNRILSELAALERKHRVTLLYACEAGSRIWGFPAATSDYDVRFLYVHLKSWYRHTPPLSAQDTIARTTSYYDILGWDLRKALAMLVHSHPTVLEWVLSYVVYYNHEGFRNRLTELATQVVSVEACQVHYLRWASRNLEKLQQSSQASIKRCCQALRPLLAVQWLERHGWPMPLSLRELAEDLPHSEIRTLIHDFLSAEYKSKRPIEDTAYRTIVGYLARELHQRAGLRQARPALKPVLAPVNAFFRTMVEQYDTSTDEELDLSDWPAPPPRS